MRSLDMDMKEPQSRLLPLKKSTSDLAGAGFVIVGFSLMGAGLCCAIFSYHLFSEAAEYQHNAEASRKSAELANNQVESLKDKPPGTKTAAGATTPFDSFQWAFFAYGQEVRARLEENISASKKDCGNQNVAVAIGLFFGGTSLVLLGWGLRRRNLKVQAIDA